MFKFLVATNTVPSDHIQTDLARFPPTPKCSFRMTNFFCNFVLLSASLNAITDTENRQSLRDICGVGP